MGVRFHFGTSEPGGSYDLRGVWIRDIDIHSLCDVLLHRHDIHPPAFKLLYNCLCIMDTSSFLLSSFIPPSSHSALFLFWLLPFLSLHTVLVGLLFQVLIHPWSRLAHGPSSVHEMLSSKNLTVKWYKDIVVAGSYYWRFSKEPVSLVIQLYAQKWPWSCSLLGTFPLILWATPPLPIDLFFAQVNQSQLLLAAAKECWLIYF